MRITIEPTDTITEANGSRVRLWKGRTESGPCDVYVALVGASDPAVQAEMEAALREAPEPTEYRGWWGSPHPLDVLARLRSAAASLLDSPGGVRRADAIAAIAEADDVLQRRGK